MTQEITIQDALELFKINWGGVHCTVEKDFMTYKVSQGYGKKAAYSANVLLRDLGLDGRLEAIGSDLPSNDSFCVKLKN